MRGISLISGILFLAFIIAATAIIYSAGIPIINNLQCASTVEKMKSSFIDLDKVVQEVSSEGEGSKRIIGLNMNEGRLYISGDNDTIYWTYDCTAPVVSPRTSQTFGNVKVGANMKTSASEGLCKGETSFILENEYLMVCVKKIGSASNKISYFMNQTLLGIYNKDIGQWLQMDYIDITLDSDPTSASGQGYTSLETSGRNLAYGTVNVYMESDYGADYTVQYVLESGEDFLIIRGE